MIYLKRAYSEVLETDGYRVLVDRLWPRGVTKERAKIDYWAKELTPTTELRKWFNHDASKLERFKQEYLAQLAERSDAQTLLQELATKSQASSITLVYGAKDPVNNHVQLLAHLIAEAYQGVVEFDVKS